MTDFGESETIDLLTPLDWRSSFRFPCQSSIARREVLIGALWVLVPVVGWLLNMGHRIVVVHNMMHGRSAWPAWRDYRALFRHGLITFLGMLFYYAPAAALAWWGATIDSQVFLIAAAVLGLAATVAIPGYMSHYCRAYDVREIFNPWLALRRCLHGGRAYWQAWGIALAALAVSFLGLLALGVGFLVTSVWFWQVAGFSFATVMTHAYGLRRA